MSRVVSLLIVVAVCCSSDMAAQSNVSLTRVSVVESVNCHGVHSTIKRGNTERIRDTNGDGVLLLEPPLDIESNQQIYASPIDVSSYFDSFMKDVEPEMEFGVVPRTPQAKTAGEELVLQVEMAGRARRRANEGDPSERCADLIAQAHEHVAYLAAGELLEVDDPVEYDAEQERVVASEALKDAIIMHQVEKGLEATGRLDYSTVDSLSGGQYTEFYWLHLFGIQVVPEPGEPPTLADDFVQYIRGLGMPEIDALVANAEHAMEEEELGVAAMLYGELAYRLWYIDVAEGRYWSEAARVETYRILGEVFSIDDGYSYDPLQGLYVMTPELSERLRVFQDESGLRETGRADYDSLRSLGGEFGGSWSAGGTP